MPENITLPNGVSLRRMNDYDSVRTNILTAVSGAFARKFPIENDQYAIYLDGLKYPDQKYDVRDEKKALLSNGGLTVPLYGKIKLYDKINKEFIDEKDGVLARVPWVTHRGTYINNGNEYAVVAGQQRLKPGIYSRRKDNGELEAHVNVMAGTGAGIRMFMEPETGVYKLMAGKSRMSMYPILKGLGVQDHEMEQWWGKDVLEKNRGTGKDTTSFGKFYQKIMGRAANLEADDNTKAVEVLQALDKSKIDEGVTERNLGIKATSLSPQVLLRTTNKLMNIHKGTEDEDDRDSIANKTFMGPEDLFEERIEKDAGGLARKLLSRSSYQRKLAGFNNGYFSSQINGLVVGNSLSVMVDGINPIQTWDIGNKVVQTGEGAIEDSDAIPMSARSLHPSQAMVIDPIKTPESGSVGIDQRFAMNTLKGSDRQVYFQLKNVKTGKMEYMTAFDMQKKVVGFPKYTRNDEMYGHFKTASILLNTRLHE